MIKAHFCTIHIAYPYLKMVLPLAGMNSMLNDCMGGIHNCFICVNRCMACFLAF